MSQVSGIADGNEMETPDDSPEVLVPWEKLWAGRPTLFFYFAPQRMRLPHPFDFAQGRLLRFLQGWAAMLPAQLLSVLQNPVA